jgi:TFIIF-interacting CTD phosphatase-like protein
MKNYIFVDLDETLLHTFQPFFGETPTKDAVKVQIEGEKELYDTVLREGALYFLHVLRNAGEVYMLTAATADYAAAMNAKFNLGFTSQNIYSREDIASGSLDVARFEVGKVYLFDNLPRSENRNKIIFLRNIGENKQVNYVQVPAFHNNKYQAFTDEIIEQLVSRIS